MKILVLNCGSSSLKLQLFDAKTDQIAPAFDQVVARGSVEKIGSPDARFTYQASGAERVEQVTSIPTHKDAIQLAFEKMTGAGGVIQSHAEIEAVGHRVVHGGERFQQAVLIDRAVLNEIEAASQLAPLHNPQNLKGYYASRELLPEARHVAVFDTSFHHTMPPRAFLYGLPYAYYTDAKVRRYGFHGISHRYISNRFAQIKNKPVDELKLITCHLGNGCSMCAVRQGKSVDTSMGFTTLEGLLMGTRPGDVDPGAILYLTRNGKTLDEMDALLNGESGLYGLSGLSNDMRDLLTACEQGNTRAKLAIEVFCYRVRKYIGAYSAVLDGADAILFAAGIGENAAPIRAAICEGLASFGIHLDELRNRNGSGKEARISPDDAPVEVWVIPTNEELLIARDTRQAVSDSGGA